MRPATDAGILAIWGERHFVLYVLRKFDMPPHDAEDAAIDLVLDAMRRFTAGKLRSIDRDHLRPYLYGAARFTAYAYALKRREVLSDERVAAAVDGAASVEDALIAGGELRRVLAKLTPEQAAVLVAFAEGRDGKEAARLLDCPLGTVYTRLRVARKLIGRKQ